MARSGDETLAEWRLSGLGAALCSLALVCAAGAVSWMFALSQAAALADSGAFDSSQCSIPLATSLRDVANAAMVLQYVAGMRLARSAVNPYARAPVHPYYSGVSCGLASLALLVGACALSGSGAPAPPWRQVLSALFFWATVLPAAACVYAGHMSCVQALPFGAAGAMALVHGAALLFPAHSAVRRMFAYYYVAEPAADQCAEDPVDT